MTNVAKVLPARTLVGAGILFVASGAMSCGTGDDEGLSTASCVAAPLPLQNQRSVAVGDTFYLPRLSSAGCPTAAAWEVSAAPPDSRNRVYMEGAPEPRFTPDRPGTYRFQ